MCKYTILVTSFFIFNLIIESPTGIYGQGRCDSSLPQIPNNPLSYRDRGDRCEGIYVQQLGSSTLQIVSFTSFFESYNLNSSRPLKISWDKFPAKDVIRLRVRSTKSKLYYRMDTYCQPVKDTFNWPVNLLTSLDIQKQDIGIVAYTQYPVNKEIKDIYLAINLSQEKKINKDTIYTLTLLPGVELLEVFLSLRELADNGKPGKLIKNGEKLGYGYYPADRPVYIRIPRLHKKGIYFLEAGAILRGGGSSTIGFWFYYPFD